MNTTSAGRLRDALTAAALFLASAAFTLWQNARVAALWDLSYLLDSSYRFRLGQMPYRDFPFVHPPLHYLLHAAIIRIFGRVYYPHVLCATFEAGLATVVTWRILLTLLKPFASRTWLLATLLAAPLTVVGIYAIYPHPIYDSDAILAILFALYLLQRADASPDHAPLSPARNLIAGAACVLPLFVKQNIGLPFLLILLAAVAAIAVSRRLQHVAIAPQLWILTGAFVTLAAAILAIHLTGGLRNYLYWTITFAGQRRLPSFGVILDTYHQTSLLWTIPAALAAIALLYIPTLGTRRWARFAALALLAFPFLWTVAGLAITNDPDDRADQLLSLWPHLLILAAGLAIWNLRRLRATPTLHTLLPIILLATIEGTFLSQQLWGSTYAIWPLLMLLIAAMLVEAPTIARPLAAIVAATFLLCGGLYATSHERLSYIQLDGPETQATLPALRGLTTPGPWIPNFEELVRFTNAEIPANDGILLLPGEDPFYFATGRAPQFPILLFDPATDPYTPQQTLDQARAHNIRWLIVNRNLQIETVAEPDLPEVLRLLQQDFAPYRNLTNYDIYRRK
ncbi:MAG: hypothetical protein ABSG84_00550 [Acidobacteriaceae bacterium]|jgi:hypothetical protein